MHGRCQFRRDMRTVVVAVALVLCTLVWIFLPSPGFAQTQEGFAQPVAFKILNATSGGPGAVERLTIDYMTARPNNIVDLRPTGSIFTIPAVPLHDAGKYIVTAWWQNVPYWFSYKGREMVADTLSIHVFDASEDIRDAAITGMTVVAQRQGEALKLEYLLEIQNSTTPQQTLVGHSHTLALQIPNGLVIQEANYSRGPDPTPIPTMTLPAGALGLSVPLTWGKNTIRLVGHLPWHEDLDLPFGFNIPLDTWGFLVSPTWMQVKSMGLEPDPAAGFQGYNRFRGPAIEAQRQLTVHLNSGDHKETTLGQVFSTEADSMDTTASAQLPAPAKSSTRNLLLLILVLALAGLILLFVANGKKSS